MTMMARVSIGRQTGFAAGLAVIFAVVQCAGARPATGQRAPLPDRSAGIFIGVEKFSHDSTLTPVGFAVNDAVDLAYSLSIERGLIPPNRVLLLLGGEPTGGAQARLDELSAKKATVQSATQANIYSLVQEQSKLVRDGGVLVLSISTHGYSEGAEHLLMAADSILEFRTGITAERLLRATQAGSGGLRLLLVDACRPQLDSLRGSRPDDRSAMRTELLEAFKHPGYIVFSAASEGQYAFVDRGNGLFTGAILDRLRCDGSDYAKGVELSDLVSFVTREVEKRSALRARDQRPELRTGGGSVDLILPPCLQPGPAPAPAAVLPNFAKKIEDAASFSEAGGWHNIEESFLLYREVFQELPREVRLTLNQGLLARAQQLKEDSPRSESIEIYRRLLHPLLAQSRASQ
ncbi:MAG TPA: caspase family protein [Thermoanaerobaculia bacterium]|nr:caspase family protein [Thermoanaerobaculia bacterium]